MFEIPRNLENQIKESLRFFPVVCILGPRQSGKTTLAQKLLSKVKDSLYLDLELDSDLRKLEHAESYLSMNQDKLICIDEIQRRPELFRLLRALIDQNKRSGRFLILGSAGIDLLQQSSESLAGRITFHELSGLNLTELKPIKSQKKSIEQTQQLWIKGGFPDSYLLPEKQSRQWRHSFIKTFLERDLGNLGFRLNPVTLKKFWQMLAHIQGQTLDKSKLANSLGVSSPTISSWLEIMEMALLVRTLPSFSGNVKKRLVKSPKVYIRDSGLLHSLLDIEGMDDLYGHPIMGSSWEGFAIEQILTIRQGWKASYYRTSNGSELDLVLEKKNQKVAVEFKSSKAAKLTKGSMEAINTLGINKIHIITPDGIGETVSDKIDIDSVQSFLKKSLP